MSALVKSYAEHTRAQYGYLPTWLPGTAVDLGAFGVIERGVFKRRGSVSQWGCDVAATLPKTVADIAYQTAGGVDTAVKVGGAASEVFSSVGKADAGVRVSFSRSDALVVHASGCVTTAIDNQIALGERLLALIESGAWEMGFVVVVEIVSAQSLTAVLSAERGAEIELKLAADLEPGAISLASVEGQLSVASSRGIGFQTVAQGDAVCLYRGLRLKRSWWSRQTRVKSAEGLDPESVENESAGELFEEADGPLE